MSVPPDLRVVCRRLVAASPAELPGLCPILVNHIMRCGGPLSSSSEGHGKATGTETARLVHKLKTQIGALLHGKTPQGRFAGAVLAKAAVDVGGWECLRTAEPWIRAMLSILQKPDPLASKELCVVVLSRIYTLLQAYPTLVREMATPTIPTLATACLQLIRPVSPGKAAAKVPLSFVETVARALAALIPLYPTTLRPFAAQLRSAIRLYVAPTASDAVMIPHSLRQAARHLLFVLPFTAPKNGSSDEWQKFVRDLLAEAHGTADQILRAVKESRDPASGFEPSEVSYDRDEPQGGSAGDGPDVLPLPLWTGLQSGAERLVGLLETLSQAFDSTTKLPVVVQVGWISSLVSRLSLVLPPAPGAQDRDYAALINPSIGREERDELWSLLPSIHAASLGLLVRMADRLGSDFVPMAPELLDDGVRMFSSSRHVPHMRQAVFSFVLSLLPLIGPTMTRQSVDSLVGVMHACCEDLLDAAGFLGGQQQQTQKQQGALPAGSGSGRSNGPKNKMSATMANADLFLNPVGLGGTASGGQGSASTSSGPGITTCRLEASHLAAAKALLPELLLYVPQKHVRKADRALLDRTAILSASHDAMVASVLHPYVDPSGRYFANTIPFLARAYADDMQMEVLRSNLRIVPHYYGNVFAPTGLADGDVDGDGDENSESNGEDSTGEGGDPMATDAATGLVSVDGELDDLAGETTAGSNHAYANGSSGKGFELATVFGNTQHGNTQQSLNTGETASPAVPAPAFELPTLKRKAIPADETAVDARKRLETGLTQGSAVSEAREPEKQAEPSGGNGSDYNDDGDSDSDSGGSVQLEMVFDDDEEEEGH